jgi:hypothetical protein
MANIGSFDARSVKPNTGRPDPVPAGWYNVAIVQSEVKATRDKQGAYLELAMRILDGQHAGHVIYDRLNLHNASQQAVDIAYGTLSAICHATGVMQITDSVQLHNIPLQARVIAKPATAEFEAGNDVKAYRSVAEGQAAGQGNAPAFGAGGPQIPTFAPPANAAPANAAPSFSPPPAYPPAAGGVPAFVPPNGGANTYTPGAAPATGVPAFTPPTGFVPPAGVATSGNVAPPWGQQ